MALPHGTTGSLGPAFTSARLISLAVKHPYALTLYARLPTVLRMPYELLRYSLGGDRPSQTAHLALSCARIHGTELDDSWHKGGISRMTPRQPELPDQHLPPILRMRQKSPIPSYSQGSRGLSVLPRVCGVLTATIISPSPSSRHCSSRYAIHARRNLPDKELRYHRTVIVTAAVYRGLGRKLLPKDDLLP
jgi:hypothetical protein